MHYQDYWYSMHWVKRYHEDWQYHQHVAASNIDHGHGHRGQFRGYKGSAKGGGKGNYGSRHPREHRREDRHGHNDVGKVAGGGHRVVEGTPDRRQRDHHNNSDESDTDNREKG